MSKEFPRLRAYLASGAWAIDPAYGEAYAEVIERRLSGIRLSREAIEAIKGPRDGLNGAAFIVDVAAESSGLPAHAAAGQASDSGAKIAVINIKGVIAQHAAQVDDISGPGGTSTERVTNSFRAALADTNVSAIVLNIDSPGGGVSGVQALADEIRASRGQKPIVAQANSLAASAAYWIASAADEIVVTPGGQVGSIGVYALHQDVSKAAEMEGVKFTFVSAGKYKVEGNFAEPLGDDARGAIQKSVDAYYSDFINAIAKGRNVKPSAVRSGFGEGRVVKDAEAVDAGMADRVGTLDDTLKRLASRKSPAQSSKSADAQKFTVKAVEGEGRRLLLEGDWPEITMFSQDVLESSDFIALDGDSVTVSLSNARALYEIAERNAADRTVVAILIQGEIDPEPAAATPNVETDAFRRRRHEHRKRSA